MRRHFWSLLGSCFVGKSLQSSCVYLAMTNNNWQDPSLGMRQQDTSKTSITMQQSTKEGMWQPRQYEKTRLLEDWRPQRFGNHKRKIMPGSDQYPQKKESQNSTINTNIKKIQQSLRLIQNKTQFGYLTEQLCSTSTESIKDSYHCSQKITMNQDE